MKPKVNNENQKPMRNKTLSEEDKEGFTEQVTWGLAG